VNATHVWEAGPHPDNNFPLVFLWGAPGSFCNILIQWETFSPFYDPPSVQWAGIWEKTLSATIYYNSLSLWETRLIYEYFKHFPT